jgi:diaminopimelate decarboxylase/aspartate kinase
VSEAEVRHARRVLGRETPLLFTPNFCPMGEYSAALAAEAEVVVDGPEPLLQAPETFRGTTLGLRLDPGRGLGHHEKVRTAGGQAKFGQPLDELDGLERAAAAAGARIGGLHAHLGSGILEPEVWGETLRMLAALVARFPHVRWIDPGGGLGVPESAEQPELDLEQLERHFAALKRDLPGVALRLEPGRYLVSEAGALVAPVTQVRRKGGVAFVGLATGMNSLLRPALYGAWHAVHNLTRLGEPAAGYWHVVGPICESGDVLGRDRLLPATAPGDVLLIENAGAYGAVMASRYNLREPAEEVVLTGESGPDPR